MAPNGRPSESRVRLMRFGAGHVELHGASEAFPLTRVSLDFNAVRARPFLKWPGGKQWLAPLAAELVPPEFAGRYFEPFLGGGSLFFSLRPERARLSDVNEELIRTYEAVRDHVEAVITELRRYPHDRAFFQRIRRARPRSPIRIAARMIYLNKTAFNGMYRVNARGEFNVPFGRYVNPGICHETRLREASRTLQSAISVRTADFDCATRSAREGDFVFMDPPYITGHTNNGFRKYNAQLFRWEDQERLSATAHKLADRGVSVAITNANHPAIRALYKDFAIIDIERRSLISSSVVTRALVPEAIYASFVPTRLGEGHPA